MKVAAKRAKTSARETAQSKRAQSLGELGSKAATVRNEKGQAKPLRPKFAVGGLDQDFMAWGMGAGVLGA